MFRPRPSVNDKLNSSGRPTTMPVLTDLDNETPIPDAAVADPAPQDAPAPDAPPVATADTPARPLPGRKTPGTASDLPPLDGINQRARGGKPRPNKADKPAKSPKAPKPPKAPKAPGEAAPMDRKKLIAAATAVTVLLAGGFVVMTQFAKPKPATGTALVNPDNEILMPQGPLPTTSADPLTGQVVTTPAQPGPGTTDPGMPGLPGATDPSGSLTPPTGPSGAVMPPAEPPAPPTQVSNTPPSLPVTTPMPSAPAGPAPVTPPVQLVGAPAKGVQAAPGTTRMPDPFSSPDDVPQKPSVPTPPQALPPAAVPTPPKVLPPIAAAPITLPTPPRVVAAPPKALPVPPRPAALPPVPALPVPSLPTAVVKNPLEVWVSDHDLSFAAYAEGVTSQIILLSNLGSITVPLGSTIPETDIKVTDLRPGAAATVTLTQGKHKLKLKIGGPQ